MSFSPFKHTEHSFVKLNLNSSSPVLDTPWFDLRRRHNGRIKTHIKFDDFGKTLFLQAKHEEDDEWTKFSAEQARKELAERNSKRAKKSRLLMSPGDSSSATSSNRAMEFLSRKERAGAADSREKFTLPQRNAPQAWDPPTRNSTTEGRPQSQSQPME